jgi:dolichyl-phosphate beta-glucosyltransferase
MSINKKPLVSVIIPVYNETIRLISGLYQVLSYLRKQAYGWELIIVDDGSTMPVRMMLDQVIHRRILRYDIRKLPVSIYRLDKNTGKGAAISLGVSKAKGEYVVFTDIDLSVPVSELANTLRYLRQYPVVIASRRLTSSKILVHQSNSREIAGRIFTVLSNLICQTHATDVTCGFKGFRTDAARKLFRKRRIDRWVFDAELLFLAGKYKISVKEFPVVWTNKSGSKVRVGDSVSAFIDLFRIRWNDMTGEYDNNKI